MTGYDALAEVYEWLISDAKLTPAEFAAAFDDVIRLLPSNARVLDCSCGTGQLAVGLSGLGMQVVATDASAAMVRRTEELAEEYGASLRTVRADWHELTDHFDIASFDMVFCVGNSLHHAEGREADLLRWNLCHGCCALRDDWFSPPALGNSCALAAPGWTSVTTSSAGMAAMLSSSIAGRLRRTGSRSTTSRLLSRKSRRMGRSLSARNCCRAGRTDTTNSDLSCTASDYGSRRARSTRRLRGTWWWRPRSTAPACVLTSGQVATATVAHVHRHFRTVRGAEGPPAAA